MDITHNTLCGCSADYENAIMVLFGAPFESRNIRRGGVAKAPSAIRSAFPDIETFSPYNRTDMMDVGIFDAGDLDL